MKFIISLLPKSHMSASSARNSSALFTFSSILLSFLLSFSSLFFFFCMSFFFFSSTSSESLLSKSFILEAAYPALLPNALETPPANIFAAPICPNISFTEDIENVFVGYLRFFKYDCFRLVALFLFQHSLINH